MSARPRSRWLALGLSMIPGWGHVYWGREFPGLAFFTVAAIAAFAVLNGLVFYVGPWKPLLVRGGAVALVAALAWSWVDIIRRTDPARLRQEAEARMTALTQGMLAYVRGDEAGAKALFSSCARIDPTDVEAMFRMGVTCARAGERAEATQWLYRARKWDLERKWSWEIREELARLEKGEEKIPLEAAAATEESAGRAGRRSRVGKDDAHDR